MAQNSLESCFVPFLQQSNDRITCCMQTQLQYEEYEHPIAVSVALIKSPGNTPSNYVLILKYHQFNRQLVLERTIPLSEQTKFELLDTGNCTRLKITDQSKKTPTDNLLLIDVDDNSDCHVNLFINRDNLSQQFMSSFMDSIENLKRCNDKNDSCKKFDFNEEHFDEKQFHDVPTQYQTNSRFYGNTASTLRSARNEMRLTEIQQRSQLLKEEREDEFVKWNKLRIFTGTWNVNGQLLKDEQKMRDYFLGCDPSPPDIYAIGFQELDLSKEAYLFNDPNGKEAHWVNLCTKSLHRGAEYKRLDCVRLIGMMLIVFVKKSLRKYVSDLESCTVGTGLLGKMGNKGAVGIRFKYQDTSVCFVNCHLAAHQEQVDRRNADYREIIARMKFFRTNSDIENHEQIYFLGDMNYRINEMTAEEIKLALESKNFTYIQERDQLNGERRSGKTFFGCEEGPIKHLPTYKYNPGTDEWDSSEKERAPAWCDRILWKVNSIAKPKCGEIIKQLIYRSHPLLKTSDHKPVSALFESAFKQIDTDKEKEVIDDIMKKLDKEENDYLPQVEIDRTEIDFGLVTFRDTPLKKLVLKNIGRNAVHYDFATKPNDSTFCKPWLQVTPSSGRIAINQSIIITFELNFDVEAHIISRLNYGVEELLDTLVLSLFGGRDIFITVSGTYKPTSFGCSIDTLVQLDRPICELMPKDMMSRFGPEIGPMLGVPKYPKNFVANTSQKSSCELLIDLGDTDTVKRPSFPIPKELYLLFDYVTKHGLYRKDLFELSGSEDRDFVRIRSACDCGRQELFDNILPGSVMEAILLFLDYLPLPVIPTRFYHRACTNCKNRSECKQIINEIPLNHRKTFEYIIYFLRELLKFRDINRLTPHFLAQKFGPVLLRSPTDASSTTHEFDSRHDSILDQSLILTLTPSQMFLYNFLE